MCYHRITQSRRLQERIRAFLQTVCESGLLFGGISGTLDWEENAIATDRRRLRRRAPGKERYP